jgi:hypothetical protein
MATTVGGVPGIQPDGSHQPLDHAPYAIPGQGPPLPGEDRGRIRDILAVGHLPRQEGLQVRLEFLGDEHLALLAPFALADHQRGLAVSEEAVSDLGLAISEARRPEESNVSSRAQDRTVVTAPASFAWRARASAWRRSRISSSVVR